MAKLEVVSQQNNSIRFSYGLLSFDVIVEKLNGRWKIVEVKDLYFNPVLHRVLVGKALAQIENKEEGISI